MLLKLKKWNVRVVNIGDKYGRNMCLTNITAPMVEFYDVRYSHTQYGQFISRYYITTILSENEYPTGLCLDTSIPEWQVSSDDMDAVIVFLKETK